MKKLLTAIALTTALPAVAHAHAASTPAPKADCCEKMKTEGKDCCNAPSAEAHQSHQN